MSVLTSAWKLRLPVLLLGACALLPACTPGDAARPSAADEARAALNVETAPAEMRPMQVRLTAVGTVTAWRELVIGSQMNGLAVVEMAVDAGDRVSEGQLLLRLDNAVLRTQIDQQKASIAEAEANLENAEQEQARSDALVTSRAISQQTADTRKTTLRTSRAKLDAAKAALAEQEAQFARTEVRARQRASSPAGQWMWDRWCPPARNWCASSATTACRWMPGCRKANSPLCARAPLSR